jgi:hypothetical protein
MENVITEQQHQTNAKEHGGSEHEAHARKPWQVPVDVYLLSVDPVEFQVESPLQSAPDTDLVFHNNCHPGFEIAFNFHDQTGDPDGYRFPKHKEDAVWSQLGEGKEACPKSAVWDIFKPLRVTENGETLVVLNENCGCAVGNFQYALNVTNGRNTVSLDPGGRNMNGGQFR